MRTTTNPLEEVILRLTKFFSRKWKFRVAVNKKYAYILNRDLWSLVECYYKLSKKRVRLLN